MLYLRLKATVIAAALQLEAQKFCCEVMPTIRRIQHEIKFFAQTKQAQHVQDCCVPVALHNQASEHTQIQVHRMAAHGQAQNSGDALKPVQASSCTPCTCVHGEGKSLSA